MMTGFSPKWGTTDRTPYSQTEKPRPLPLFPAWYSQSRREHQLRGESHTNLSCSWGDFRNSSKCTPCLELVRPWVPPWLWASLDVACVHL